MFQAAQSNGKTQRSATDGPQCRDVTPEDIDNFEGFLVGGQAYPTYASALAAKPLGVPIVKGNGWEYAPTMTAVSYTHLTLPTNREV